jgi:heme A synthase
MVGRRLAGFIAALYVVPVALALTVGRRWRWLTIIALFVLTIAAVLGFTEVLSSTGYILG